MAKSSDKLPTLELVSSHFADWRAHRRHRREAIPDTLWSEVGSLVSRYSTADIVRELKLKPRQMRENINRIMPGGPKFVGISLPSPYGTEETVMIELVHSNGLRLRLQSVSDKQFDSLVTHFIAIS
jgi:hypothetical protein